MAFQFTEQHKIEYETQGVTVLRGLIPVTLLADLRREAEKAREIAHQKYGTQAQRLQPVYAYEELHHPTFRDFTSLPGLQATVAGILGTGHRETNILGILLEPAEKAWSTHWHRDWGYNVKPMDLDAFFRAIPNLRLFNQLNAALYDDHSLWVVPGSHNRQDTEAERAAFPCIPPPPPELTAQMTPEERERACMEYAWQMPGATQLTLGAGDVAFYRACQWHLGSYVPYAKRATLHDGFYSEEDYAWQEQVRRWREKAGSRGEAEGVKG